MTVISGKHYIDLTTKDNGLTTNNCVLSLEIRFKNLGKRKPSLETQSVKKNGEVIITHEPWTSVGFWE